jgi:hypothetical protein
MARATRLPEIHINDQGVAFEPLASPEGLTQLASTFSGEVLSIEVTPDDGSVVAAWWWVNSIPTARQST